MNRQILRLVFDLRSGQVGFNFESENKIIGNHFPRIAMHFNDLFRRNLTLAAIDCPKQEQPRNKGAGVEQETGTNVRPSCRLRWHLNFRR